MHRTLTLAALLMAGAAAVVLGGCSGSGAPAEQVRGGPLQTLAVDSLSAITSVAGWSEIFYMPVSNVNPDVDFDPETEITRLHATAPDGALIEYFVRPDDSSYGTIKWPNGETFSQTATLEWGAGGTTSHEEIANLYPNGGRLTYTVDAEYGTSTSSEWAGTATLPGGRALSFQMKRTGTILDDLTVRFGDGSLLTLVVPTNDDTAAVQYGAETTGRYVNSRGQELSLLLTGDTRWKTLTIEGADGTTGSFALGDDMEGAGDLRKEGAVVAALRWGMSWTGILELLGASQVEVTPSAAARDFRIDQWTDHALRLGPQPLY